MPSATEVLALYRTFLREGRKFPNYNIREYILRRAKEDFHAHAAEKDAGRIQQFWSKAQEELQVVKRQSIVYNLYGRHIKNILELEQDKGKGLAGV